MLISHVFPQMLFLLLDCNDKHQRLWYFFQFLWEWRHIPPAMYSLRYQSHFLKLVDLMMRTAEQIFSKWCLLPMRMLMVQHQLIYWSLKHSAPCIYRNSSPDLEHKLVEQSLAISIPHTSSSATVICIADFMLTCAHLPCKTHFCLKLHKDYSLTFCSWFS